MVVLLSTTLVIVSTRFMWWQLLPLHLRTLGASDAQVGLVFTVMMLLGPSQLVGGMVSDRWGRRYAIAVPSLLLVPTLVIGVLIRHWLWLAATTWLIALWGGIQQPGFQALLAESATDDDRGRVFGMFYTVAALATMLGPAVGAILLPVLGVVGLMLVNACGALVSGLARLLLLREGQYATVSAHLTRIKTGEIIRAPLIRRLIGINALFLLLLSLTRDGPFVALHAADSLGLNEAAVNVLFAIGGTGATAVALVGGVLADRVGGRRSSAIGLVSLTVLLIVWSNINWLGWLGYSVFGLGWITLQIGIVGYSSWASAFAPSAIRGRVLGVVGAVGAVVSAIGPQIGTLLRSGSMLLLANSPLTGMEWMAQMASSAPFVLAFVVAVVLAFLVLRMPSRQEISGVVEARLH